MKKTLIIVSVVIVALVVGVFIVRYYNHNNKLGSASFAPVQINQGGTSTSTAPCYGCILTGNHGGTYDYVASSTFSSGGSGGSAFPFTPQTGYVSTSTVVGFFNGLFSNASSTFSKLNIGNSTTTNATTTNFYVSGNLNVGGTANLGPLNFPTDGGLFTWVDEPQSAAVNGTPQGYTARLDGLAAIKVYGVADGAGGVTNLAVGIGTTSPYAFLSVQSGASTGDAFAVATSTKAPIFRIDNVGHQFVVGFKPTCDANCTITQGNDNAFRVNLGSGVTSSTVTFHDSWGTIAPICMANEGSAGTVDVNASSTPTTVVLTALSALTSKDVEIRCIGIQ